MSIPSLRHRICLALVPLLVAIPTGLAMGQSLGNLAKPKSAEARKVKSKTITNEDLKNAKGKISSSRVPDYLLNQKGSSQLYQRSGGGASRPSVATPSTLQVPRRSG